MIEPLDKIISDLRNSKSPYVKTVIDYWDYSERDKTVLKELLTEYDLEDEDDIKINQMMLDGRKQMRIGFIPILRKMHREYEKMKAKQ